MIDHQDWITSYLGLGSNLTNELGSPVEHLQRAVDSLNQCDDICRLRMSSLYVSQPMGPQDQPDFINAVIELETILEAYELLTLCQDLEKQAMRTRIRHWGARSLDVDILLYGQQQITEPDLTIPHAGLTQRNFVLVPLRELVPELIIVDRPIHHYQLSDDWNGLKRFINE